MLARPYQDIPCQNFCFSQSDKYGNVIGIYSHRLVMLVSILICHCELSCKLPLCSFGLFSFFKYCLIVIDFISWVLSFYILQIFSVFSLLVNFIYDVFCWKNDLTLIWPIFYYLYSLSSFLKKILPSPYHIEISLVLPSFFQSMINLQNYI